MNSFDPYYNWLGIPPRDQPPNHYRLLGIELFESHPDVIQNASDRQMAHLRTFSTSKRAALAQTLLNHVAAAKICLLDPIRKERYDATLRVPAIDELVCLEASAAHPSTDDGQCILPVELPSANHVSAGVPADQTAQCGVSEGSVFENLRSAGATGSVTNASHSRRITPKNKPLEIAKIIGGGIGGIAAGALILLLFGPHVVRRQSQGKVDVPPTQVVSAPPVSETKPAATSSETEPTQRSTTSSSQSPIVETKVAKRDVPPTNGKEQTQQVKTIVTGNSTDTESGEKGVSKPSDPATNVDVVNTGSRTITETAESQPAVTSPVTDAASHDSLPVSIDLPAAGSTSWQTLFPVRPSVLESLQLIPVAVAAYSNLSLTLDRKSDSTSRAWAVRFEIRAGDGAVQSSGIVAQLSGSKQNEELQFLWTDEDPTAIAGLRNSWLTLEFDGQRKWIALRSARNVAPAKLDFKLDRQLIPLTIDASPPLELLELDIPNVSGISPNAKFRKEINSARVDRNIVVEFSDVPGAEIRLQLKRTRPTQFALLVMPRFKENAAQEFELTFPQLEKTKKGSERSLQESRERIAKLEAAVNRANSALSSARKARGADRNETERINVMVNSRIAELREAERQLKDANQDAAKAQSRLNAVQPIETFLNSLQEKTIPFRVLVRGTSQELVLIHGSDAALQGPSSATGDSP